MDKSTNWLIYPVAIINGLGQSITLSTGIVLIVKNKNEKNSKIF